MTIIHLPKRITQRHMPVPFGPDYNTVLAYADQLALKRFNVKTRQLTAEQQEIIIEGIEQMLRDLDELRQQGRAS